MPEFDPTYRPGDNLFTNSAISYNPDTGSMNWYFQYTPNDMWDYDEVGTHILIDGQINGETRKLVTHSARNGFVYTMERANGQIVLAKPYMDKINWTRGIDQKTGKPLDYDPNKDVQTYSGIANQNPNEPTKTLCPSIAGGNNYWPSSYSPKTRLLYIPALTACSDVTIDTSPRRAGHELDRRLVQDRRSLREQSHRRRSDHRRDQEELCTSPIRTTAARWRRPADSCSWRCSTAPSSPMTTPRSRSCGGSTLAPASRRRR